jgi:DNA-binding SARP family transcriptional activator
MGELKVQLFGNFRLTYNSELLTTFKTPRLQALFAFLILNHGKPQFRSQIAYTFWPESPEAQARTNLRNLIHLLNKALPDIEQFVKFDGQILLWREAAPYTLDVLEFERLIAPAPRVTPTIENLNRAIRLYQGDLLSGCYDDWIIPEREQLQRAYLAALESLAEAAENSRNYPAALDYTHSLLQSDPVNAASNRRLIRLYSLMENRPAALKAYLAYAGLLERELGIPPDQELQNLYAHLKHQTGKVASPLKKISQTALVGRLAEWQKLQAVWRSAASGNSLAMFIRGEAGIGKTRLVEELLQWANQQGIRSATANCYPAEGNLPYAPVVGWLRSRPIPQLDPIWLAELSRLMPELYQKHPKLAPPTPLTESWQRLRLFEALARAILASRDKQLLVIEDIHWCDQDTLEWLHYLLRFDALAPILVLATERNEEILAPEHPLMTLKAMLANISKYNEVDLKALEKAGSFELAVQVAQNTTNQVLQPELLEKIFQQTEGNPLYIIEMIRLGYPLQAQSSIESLSESGKVRTLLKRRINQITPSSRDLASLAATIGREFPLEVLHQASGQIEANLVKALDELTQRRIIQETSPDNFDFTHDMLRQAAFDGLSTAHRRLLHRQVAEAYFNLGKNSLRPRHSEIAHHYELAGLHLPAIHHYRLAAEAAVQIAANADAQHFLQRAIYLSEAQGIDETSGIVVADFAGLLVRLGELQVLNGQNSEALVTLERALAQPFSPPGLWRSQIYRKISDAQFQLHQISLAFSALGQAELALNQPLTGSALEERQEWLQVQLARSQLFYWNNQPGQIDALVQKIHPIIKADGRMDQLSELLSIQFMSRLRHERYRLSQETLMICRQRLDLAEKFADPYTLAFAQFQLGFGMLWYGDTQSAREWTTKGFEAAERLGARLLQLRCLTYLNIIDRKLNNLDLVRRQTPQLLKQALDMNEHSYYGIALANQGWLAWQDGDEMSAVNLCQAAIKNWSQNAGNYTFQSLAVWVLLAIAVSHKDLGESEHLAQVLLDPNPILQLIEEPMAGLLGRAISARLEKNSEEALILYCQAVEQAKDHREL